MALFPSVPLATDPSRSDPVDSYCPVPTNLLVLDAQLIVPQHIAQNAARIFWLEAERRTSNSEPRTFNSPKPPKATLKPLQSHHKAI